jgi:hypothetical protein
MAAPLFIEETRACSSCHVINPVREACLAKRSYASVARCLVQTSYQIIYPEWKANIKNPSKNPSFEEGDNDRGNEYPESGLIEEVMCILNRDNIRYGKRNEIQACQDGGLIEFQSRGCGRRKK